MLRLKHVLAAAALLLFGLSLSQRALSATYAFTGLKDGGTVAPVATLSITDVAGGAQFSLTGTFGWLPPSAFLSHLWFNGPAGMVTAVAGNAFNAALAYGPTTNAGYHFTWDAIYPVSGAPGSDRFLATDFSSWQILGAGITAASFTLPMMVHIQGLEGNTLGLDGSIKVLAAVPEPGACGMLLAGLALIGAMARRRTAAVS
ncbi:MAG: PEP-CTERM sorting domain-containing protein [Caenispirillum sp.]|nr:PEP-CTERM sorting domain-containing protein [Caenispirillum sp.]